MIVKMELLDAKWIPGYKGRYAITPTGKVYSTFKKGFLLPEVVHNGYYRVNLGGKRWRVHRLVALTYHPEELAELLKDYALDELEVHHIDENIKNNHADNLEWLTVYEHR